MATGVSAGVIIVPFLAMISYTLVPIPVVFASLTLTMMMAYQGRREIDLQNTLVVSISMLVGILCSVYLLSHIHFDYLGLIFGIFILISVLISLKVPHFELSTFASFSGGFIAGVMGTMAAVGGQILALLFQHHPLVSIKATLAFLYTLFSLTMLAIFALFGDLAQEQLISGVYLMPGFIIGFLSAPYFSRYVNPRHSKSIVLLMATIGSLILIYYSLSL
jgi:uncharacterized protein